MYRFILRWIIACLMLCFSCFLGVARSQSLEEGGRGGRKETGARAVHQEGHSRGLASGRMPASIYVFPDICPIYISDIHRIFYSIHTYVNCLSDICPVYVRCAPDIYIYIYIHPVFTRYVGFRVAAREMSWRPCLQAVYLVSSLCCRYVSDTKS